MVQGPSLEVLNTIRNPSSLADQITALKQVKNEIVGHDQRKEIVVKHGILEPLVSILSPSTHSSTASTGTNAPAAKGKRRIGAETNGTTGAGHVSSGQYAWRQEDEARLQATLIVGTMANGGRAFISPLVAAQAPKALLDTLEVETVPRLITAILQALGNIVAVGGTDVGIFNSGTRIEAFQRLLQSAGTTSPHRQHLKLVVEIITYAASNDETRTALVNSGILDSLAALVASYSIASKNVECRRSTSHLPSPPSPTTVPSILSAITAIVTGSNYRAQCFTYSLTIRQLLSGVDTTSGLGHQTDHLLPPLRTPSSKSVTFSNVANGSAAFPALASLQHSANPDRWTAAQHAFDHVIPQPSDPEHAMAVLSWLLYLARSMQGLARMNVLRLLALVNNAVEASDLRKWFSRDQCIHRHYYKVERERQLSMLAVPLAAKLVPHLSDAKDAELVIDEKESQQLKKQACEVLALLIQSSKHLQIAAVEAGAIQRVCPVLKKSFDIVPIHNPPWPGGRTSSSRTSTDQQDMSKSCQMGPRDLPAEINHAMKVRASALEAIAALAAKEDPHRKAIVGSGVVTCIIDSLKPFPPDVLASNASNSSTVPINVSPKHGNATAVLLAACHAAQSMSRSVSLLRTSLIDAGIAKPIFELLSHRDSDVQIAATDVCCNLLLEFSPMREDLLAFAPTTPSPAAARSDGGVPSGTPAVVRLLCSHARQSEMRLRLSSLWALKHLVMNAGREVMIGALEELGTGWLVGAIKGQQGDISASAAVSAGGGVSIGAAMGGLSTPNAAGEQVDLLNPESVVMDVDDDERIEVQEGGGDEDEQEEGREEGEGDEDGEVMYDEATSTHYQASGLRSTLHQPHGPSHSTHNPPPLAASSSPPFNISKYLSSVREIEQNPALQAKRDDIAVQEQALDFVRNLLNGPEDCAFMLEHLLERIGINGFFGLLSDKLAPVSLTPTSGNVASSASGGARPTHQPTQLILSTIHVLTHIANSSPRHKQLLIAASSTSHNSTSTSTRSHSSTPSTLLTNWLPHFAHPDFRVRVISVWAINSLTWVEDESDRADAVRRVRCLREVGIVDAVRRLENDGCLDVRERVRTAIRQCEGL